MNQLTFKQYSEALAIAEAGGERPDFISEGPIWDKIKATAKKAVSGSTELRPEELEKLHALSVKGNVKARRDLDAYFRTKEKEGKLEGRLAKVAAAHQAHKDSLEKKFQQGRAEIEASERGSSRAYDRETGSGKKGEVRWDTTAKRWVSNWSHVGKHD